VAISEYLNDALSTGDAMVIAKAIGDMVRAQGMSRFSRKSGLGRENLYRIFNGKMNPKIETVMKAVMALDIQLMAKPSALLQN
jgi:probable addiction module antidote protein